MGIRGCNRTPRTCLVYFLVPGPPPRPLARSLEVIEGILNNDRKTATYKLALFRALAEIATTEFEQARWISSGVVGIPVSAVSEKWIYYYWPLLEPPELIPQIRSEYSPTGAPIAFRSLLSELIDHYRAAGGLTRFVLDLRSDTMPPHVEKLLKQLQSKLRETIVSGPVSARLDPGCHPSPPHQPLILASCMELILPEFAQNYSLELSCVWKRMALNSFTCLVMAISVGRRSMLDAP
jgi:hypothetical protein